MPTLLILLAAVAAGLAISVSRAQAAPAHPLLPQGQGPSLLQGQTYQLSLLDSSQATDPFALGAALLPMGWAVTAAPLPTGPVTAPNGIVASSWILSATRIGKTLSPPAGGGLSPRFSLVMAKGPGL
jgi:hypothetical protein